MIGLEPVEVTPERVESLRRALEEGPEILSFREDPALAGWIACLGLQREIGTLNDELSWHLFNARTGNPIEGEQVRAELVQYRGVMGVRIWVPGFDRLEVRKAGLRGLLHPRFSFHEDGSLFQLVFFPESIARILALESVDAVVVRAWALNTIFGGFDPASRYYEVNRWELQTNDALFFARLIAARKLAFLGSHDLASHIAGVRREDWDFLVTSAARLIRTIELSLVGETAQSLASRVIPYLLGVWLDDLAQPAHAGEVGRVRILEAGMQFLQSSPASKFGDGTLMKFPGSFQSVLDLGRCENFDRIEREAEPAFQELSREIRRALITGPMPLEFPVR